ncbi:hypothetical protein AAHH78_36645, partial [Burkholderia pseudomallei]
RHAAALPAGVAFRMSVSGVVDLGDVFRVVVGFVLSADLLHVVAVVRGLEGYIGDGVEIDGGEA